MEEEDQHSITSGKIMYTQYLLIKKSECPFLGL